MFTLILVCDSFAIAALKIVVEDLGECLIESSLIVQLQARGLKTRTQFLCWCSSGLWLQISQQGNYLLSETPLSGCFCLLFCFCYFEVVWFILVTAFICTDFK